MCFATAGRGRGDLIFVHWALLVQAGDVRGIYGEGVESVNGIAMALTFHPINPIFHRQSTSIE